MCRFRWQLSLLVKTNCSICPKAREAGSTTSDIIHTHTHTHAHTHTHTHRLHEEFFELTAASHEWNTTSFANSLFQKTSMQCGTVEISQKLSENNRGSPPLQSNLSGHSNVEKQGKRSGNTYTQSTHTLKCPPCMSEF